MTEKNSDIEFFIVLVFTLGIILQKFLNDNPGFLLDLAKAFGIITGTILAVTFIYFYITNDFFRNFIKIILSYSLHILLILNLILSVILIKVGYSKISISSIAIAICFILYLLRKIKIRISDKITEQNKIAKLSEKNKNIIKKILNFDPYNHTIERMKYHLNYIGTQKDTNEFYTKYEAEIAEHIKEVQKVLKNKKHEEKLLTLKEQEKEILERIKEAKELEREHKLTEEQEVEERKDKFLEKYDDEIYLYLNSLNKLKIQWLRESGYRKAQQWDLIHQQLKDIMIKPRSNESVSHAFVTANITKYLQDNLKLKSVELYQTKKPDIVFKIKNKKWAIEVETGTMLKKKPKEFRQKIEMLKTDFGKNWCIVVTNKKLIKKYRKYGTVLERSKVIDFFDDLVSFSPFE